MQLRSVASWVVGVLVTTMLVGCGSKPAWEQTHPTSGSVTFKGKPIESVEIAFFPTDPKVPESVRPRAKTAADGKFVVSTYKTDDGAPAGSYKVTFIHNEVAVSKGTVVAKPNDLPPKYSKRDTTDIEVKISPGSNELPTFELK